ncbi:MAG TPA: hypothetical protein H9691_07320 [Firmicutes bacterium]|nr:hypothetical protein [Bacillota bacterium]
MAIIEEILLKEQGKFFFFHEKRKKKARKQGYAGPCRKRSDYDWIFADGGLCAGGISDRETAVFTKSVRETKSLGAFGDFGWSLSIPDHFGAMYHRV